MEAIPSHLGDTVGRSGANPRRCRAAVAVLLVASVLLHGALLPTTGWEEDLHWFGAWMRAAIEHGVAHVGDTVWCDYPPGYLYLLKGVGLLWMAITGAALPADDTLVLRVLLKLIPTAADVGAAWVLYRIASGRFAPPRARRAQALVVLAAYAFNPAVLFNTAVWGQCDSVVAFLLLVATWAICSCYFATGFAIATAAVLVKLQAVVVLPALLLATIRLGGASAFFAACSGAGGCALLLALPFFTADRVAVLMTTILGASGRYPFISMNAHNVWWVVGGPRSASISDAVRVGSSVLTYRSFGLIMVGTAIGAVLWRLWRDLYRAKRHPFPALVEACALSIVAFYLFPTEMHERYIVPAIVFLAAACIWTPWAWVPYGLCSVGVLASLAGTLHGKYPLVPGRAGGLLLAVRANRFGLPAVFVGIFLALLLRIPHRRFRDHMIRQIDARLANER